MLANCSQSRRGFVEDSISVAESACSVPVGANEANEAAGCWSFVKNNSQNLLEVSVGTLMFNPAEFPYRILAFSPQTGMWHIILDNITASQNQSFIVDINSINVDVGTFTQWYVETTQTVDEFTGELVAANPLSGELLAWTD